MENLAAEARGEEPPNAPPEEDVFCLDCGLRKTDPEATHCPECGQEYGVEKPTRYCGGCGAVKLMGEPCVVCGSEEEVHKCDLCLEVMEDETQTRCENCRENALWCPGCGEALRPGVIPDFCPHCGADFSEKKLWCPACFKTLPEGDVPDECPHCGADLSENDYDEECPACGEGVPPDADKCPHCGEEFE
jgi:predicted amidophosphoribosyltransferase